MRTARRPAARLGATALALAALVALSGGALADGVPAHVAAVDEDGRPVAGAEIVETRAAEDGIVLYDASAPVLAVTGPTGAVSPLPSPMSAGGRLAIRRAGSAAVLLPSSPAPIAARLWPGVTIAGSVEGADGGPAPGMSVIALPLPGTSDLGHRTRTDERGLFALANVTPGAYRLRVVRPDGTARDFGTVAAPSTLAPLSWKRGAMLKGRVFDSVFAKPAAGVRVALRPVRPETGGAAPSGGAPETRSGAAGEGSLVRLDPEAETDADGRITFPDVAPGIYEARVVTADGKAPRRIFDGEPPRVQVDQARVRRLETWWVVPRRSVRGLVLDVDRKPVAGATVLLSHLPGTRAPEGGWGPDDPTVVTGDDGRFVFEGVAASRDWRVVVTAPRFAPSVLAPVVVDRREDTDVRWIVLKAPWSLDVVVRDADGKPVAGATASVLPASRPDPDPEDAIAKSLLRSAATDAEGAASIVDLPNEDVLLRVTKDGHVEANRVVPVAGSSRVRRERVTLARTASIVGRVTAAGGTPPPMIVRATVRATGLERTAVPQKDGAFRLDDLPPVATDVEAVATDGPRSLVLARREAVLPGSGEAVLLPIPERRTVAGTLGAIVPASTTGPGAPPATVRLEVGRYDPEGDRWRWEVAAETAVPRDAETAPFSFASVPPGVYALRGVQGLRDTGPIPVRVEDRDATGVALVLPRTARLVGSVYDARSRSPRLGATLTLVRVQGDGDAPSAASSPPPTKVLDDTGRYELEGVAPGLWRVEARDRDGPPAAEVVRAVEGETLRVPDLRLTAGGRIAGTVKDEDGKGLAGIGVRLFALPGLDEAPRAVTAEDGSFATAALAAGRYLLRAGREAPGTAKAPALEAEVDVVEGETTKVALGAAGRARIDGVVRRRGRVVAGVAVEATREGVGGTETSLLRATTDDVGRFRWDGLAAGRYVLWLVDGTVRSGRTIDLAEGDRAQRELELYEGRIAGRVTNALGDAVAGAEVVAEPSDGCACVAVGRTRTGPDGRFVFAGLPLGPYRVEVAPPGLPTRRLEPVVADLPGSEPNLEVVVGRGGSLDLRVVDLGRRGVTAAEVSIETRDGVPLLGRSLYTGSSGTLHVDGLPEGEARVVVHARGYGRPAPRPVPIRDGLSSALEITVRPASSLAVVVTAGRDPVGRARVDLLRLGSNEPIERRRGLGRVGNEWGLTPRTGVVTIRDLEEGDYVVVVDAGTWYDEVRVPVRVRGLDPTEVTIEVPPRTR